MTQVVKAAGVMARHNGGGLVRTTSGEAWLYYEMSSQPTVSDAVDWNDRAKAAQPFLTIMSRLADLVPHIPLANRKTLKTFYRQIHILAVSTPTRFTPSPTLDEDNRMRLLRDYGEEPVHDRFTLFGVRLEQGGSEKKRSLWGKVSDLLTQATEQVAFAEVGDDAFAVDRKRIDRILRDGGCRPPSETTMKRALTWWATDPKPDPIPVMVERGHMHAFRSERDAALAEKMRDTQIDCTKWAGRYEIRGTWPMTVVTLGALPFKGEDERVAPGADWAAQLLKSSDAGGQGCVALSVRGLVEPGEQSREQIDKDKDKVLDQAIKQATDGHKQNIKIASALNEVSDVYQMDGRPWPTLVEGRVHAACPNIIERANQVTYPGLVTMNKERQDAAFQDMMIGSDLMYNPSPVYWPAPIVAFAGLAGRSIAGEDYGLGRKEDLPGALLGMTEVDRQPVYVSPFAAAVRHTPPALLVTGRTGSGKTRVLMHLAAQWARLRNPDNPREYIPGVFFDPKPNSTDFGPFVRSMGGTIIRLDSKEAEGVLDPMRCIPLTMPDMITNTAVEMLSQITGGANAARERDMALTSIIGYGIAHGADCTGEAVHIAYEAYRAHGKDSRDIDPLVEQVAPMLERLYLNSPMFRLIYGHSHGGRRLAISDGLTLLSAGTMNIISEKEANSGPSDIQRWVVRMAALGASASIIGRNGFLVVDEAWSLLGDRFGVSIVNSMGRLARDQHYFPVFASQKVTEFVQAGLQDFTGRGIALAMGSRAEFAGMESQTEQVCRLFGQPEDGVMAERMTHDRELKADPGEQGGVPDRRSLYALFDPNTGELERGSIGYYIGLDQSAIPVEIRISDKLV